MRAYMMDLRVRVLGACDDGTTTAVVAEAFGVSGLWVRDLRRRFREAGEVGPRTPPAAARPRHWPPTLTGRSPSSRQTSV